MPFFPDYLDRRAGVPAFSESALFNFQSINLATAGAPERVVGLRTTASPASSSPTSPRATRSSR